MTHPELHAALDLVRDGDQLLICRTVGKRTSRVSGPAVADGGAVGVDTLVVVHPIRLRSLTTTLGTYRGLIEGPITYLSVRRGTHLVAEWRAANTTEGAENG